MKRVPVDSLVKLEKFRPWPTSCSTTGARSIWLEGL
jgi:hypothetical protein